MLVCTSKCIRKCIPSVTSYNLSGLPVPPLQLINGRKHVKWKIALRKMENLTPNRNNFYCRKTGNDLEHNKNPYRLNVTIESLPFLSLQCKIFIQLLSQCHIIRVESNQNVHIFYILRAHTMQKSLNCLHTIPNTPDMCKKDNVIFWRKATAQGMWLMASRHGIVRGILKEAWESVEQTI